MSIIPYAWTPDALMQRIIMHWTAGQHKASDLDLSHYHFVVEGSGKLQRGKVSVKANEAPAKAGYAAHTLNCNSGSIGVSMACMAGAIESPFSPGKQPMTAEQYGAFVNVVAELCDRYRIPVTPRTVLSHAEVQGTLKIKQRGKWDFTRLSPFPSLLGAQACGDKIRADVAALIGGRPPLDVDVERPDGEGKLTAGIVTATNLILREGPSGASRNLGSMPKGTRLLIHGKNGVWLNVQTPFGARGWASGTYVNTAEFASA